LIPEGWQVGTVADIVDIQKGSLRPSDFVDEIFNLYSIPAYDAGKTPELQSGAQIKSNKFVVSANAVLISKLNPNIPRVWRPWGSSSRRQICSTEFIVVTPRDGFATDYLQSFFTSECFFSTFSTLVTGTSGSHQRVKPDYFTSMTALILYRTRFLGHNFAPRLTHAAALSQ
jgi:type I restriction enzyme, S subunit